MFLEGFSSEECKAPILPWQVRKHEEFYHGLTCLSQIIDQRPLLQLPVTPTHFEASVARSPAEWISFPVAAVTNCYELDVLTRHTLIFIWL